MKKNNGFSDKVGNFLDGKGFYIALVLCLAVIGGSTYYLIHSLSNLSSSVEEAQPANATAEIAVDPILEDADLFTQEELPEEAEEVIQTQEEEAQEAAAPVEEAAAEPEQVKVTTWPIQGSIVTAFSPDALVANETMGDWRTHEGIDLAALAGTNVQAVADGTVTSIDSDLLLGTVMTVSHEGGLTSIYGNLDAETLVEVGDKVSAGCVLGQVGLTAAGETATGDHLHFAMELNGENVNPKDYLP
jgi:murein DD-endopeptidase MepM/ murein hydrolase activator NlpD